MERWFVAAILDSLMGEGHDATEVSMGTRCVLRMVCLLAACTGSASGYALLDFPSDVAVQIGSYKAWQTDTDNPYSLSLSYSVESNFLDNVPGSQQAVQNVLSSWSSATGNVVFTPADYEPVENSGANWMAGGFMWEGAGAAAGGTGIGANIDIMARPTGFTVDFFGQTASFGPNTLAFVLPISMGDTIVSADVYLNSDFNWSTLGDDFDVETALLHETGHALGLDHPDQAVDNGAANYDPYTQEPGASWSLTDVMHSGYYPDGLNRTLTDDDIGGIAFLYPGLAGDANLDGKFTFGDVQLAIDMFFGYADTPNPAALQNIDLNGNNLLNFSDVDSLITKYFYPDQSPPDPNQSLLILEEMGYNTSGLTLPEPNSFLLLLAIFGAWRPARRRLE